MADKRYEYEVTADVTQFRRAMESVAQGSRDSARAVSTAFAGAERGLSSLTNVATSLRNALGGVLSVGGVVAFGKAIATSTIEAERSAALLNATLRSTGYSAGLSARDVETLVGELAQISKLDDDPIREATTALLRFRGISGETFREAARLAVDLSVATGRDLPSAFTAVGRALQDPINGIRGLREVGVTLSDGQEDLARKLVETGRAAEAQRIVLDELSKSVGGTGAAGAGGLAGATRALSNAWDDLLRNIGKLPAVAGSSQGVLSQFVGIVERAAGAVDFFGTPDGGTVAELNSRIAGLKGARERYVRSNADTSTIDLAISSAEKRRSEVLLRIGEMAVAQSGPKNFDARDLRLLNPGGALSPKKIAASSAKSGYEAEYQAALAAGKAFSDEELRRLNQQADEKIRIEREVQDDRIKILQEGPDIAERQQREQAQQLNSLLAQTRTGQEQAVIKDLDLLNDALIRGTISAEQYEEAYGNIQKRFNEIREVGKNAHNALTEDGARAYRELTAAVEGWGNATAEQLVRMVKTAKFEFGSLVDVILTDLARLAIQQGITRPIFSALAGKLGAAVFGSGSNPTPAGTPFGYVYGGGYADGGEVTGGHWYTVGEKGPERLYVPPGGSGTIVPNGGGGGINYRQTVVINAPTDGAVIRAAVMQGAAMARSDIARLGRVGAMS